jgi:hypothetical protein
MLEYYKEIIFEQVERYEKTEFKGSIDNTCPRHDAGSDTGHRLYHDNRTGGNYAGSDIYRDSHDNVDINTD